MVKQVDRQAGQAGLELGERQGRINMGEWQTRAQKQQEQQPAIANVCMARCIVAQPDSTPALAPAAPHVRCLAALLQVLCHTDHAAQPASSASQAVGRALGCNAAPLPALSHHQGCVAQ